MFNKNYFIITFFFIFNVSAVHVISIGQTCTTAVTLRHFGIRSIAYPFDWTVTPFEALYKVFEDDFKYFLNYQSLHIRLPDHYGVLDYYGIHFVHDFPAITPNDGAEAIDKHHVIGGVLRDDWQNYIPAVQMKYQRRIERLRILLLSSEKVYFIRHFDMTKDQAIQFRNLLRTKYPNLDFTLLIIDRNEEIKNEWNLDNIKNFYLDDRNEPNNPELWHSILQTMHLI